MSISNDGKNKGYGNLKPIKPGEVRNPNGRPKIPEDVRNAFRAHTMDAKNTLIEIMMDKEAKSGDRVRSAEIVLNRAWGTPEQSVSVSGSIATTEVDTSKLDKKSQNDLLNAMVALYGVNSDSQELEDEAETTD